MLFGLTTLQQGMGGLAESLHPSDLPAVLGAPGVGWLSGSLGLLTLVVVGLVMTAVMQSSTASIAVTLSAYYAGAIGVDQGCALIIGQNIGTATSSAMAAIGASTTAKRLAVAYILFKVIAALIALVLFPFTIPLLVGAESAVDGVTLLAAYHTAYNVVGVLVLMPVIGWFTRFVERLLPDRTSPLTRCLDPAALAIPIAAAEGVRRTVARAIASICRSIDAALTAGSGGEGPRLETAASVTEAAEALDKALKFMSDVSGPPEDADEQRRVTSTLHALDHATRLAETAGGETAFTTAKGEAEDARASELCSEAMQCAASVAGDVAAQPADIDRTGPPEPRRNGTGSPDANATRAAPAALARLEEAAKALGALRLAHRSVTLGKVATGELTADEAIARVDAVTRLQALAHHAWRSAAYLVCRGA